VSPLRIITATVRRNIRVAMRYLPNLVGSLTEMGVRALFFLLLANSISMRGMNSSGIEFSGHDLYVFLLGSLSLFVFTRSTLNGPINAVNNDLYNGTLEYLYSGPGSRYAYYVGVVISEVLISMVVFIPLFILLVIVSGVSLLNLGMMLLACLGVLISLTAMGIMIGLLALVWKQVGSVASLLGILFEMIAGAYLPLSVFPRAIQYVAYLLPFTWGYDLLRYYSFSEQQWQPILPIWQEWAVVGLFAVTFTLASRFLLGKAERLAKQQGLHIL
ncbi:MAG: ABC transporter permease, partial [Anaerolineaceae bacterium]|nr:ABC transporter permease [Anaerolineaceae bacterium]